MHSEATAWERLQEIRACFSPQLSAAVALDDRQQALARGIDTLRLILIELRTAGLILDNADPGHGIGHLGRDFANALVLLQHQEASPADLYVGLVAGVLHDLGCALTERYADPGRAVRHAEVGALVFDWIARRHPREIPAAERILITYAIAAHTNYRQAAEIRCSDGAIRRIEPYTDTHDGGDPIWAVQIPRWVDRLDAMGPGMVGRHYLTLAQPHMDYGSNGFYPIALEAHLLPLLRTREIIRAAGGQMTMLEHLAKFLPRPGDPYQRYDTGYFRDALLPEYAKHTQRILHAVLHGETTPDTSQALEQWTAFVTQIIERAPAARTAATSLQKQFSALDTRTQQAWCRGFMETQRCYAVWARRTLQRLRDFPPQWLALPLLGDVRQAIAPLR